MLTKADEIRKLHGLAEKRNGRGIKRVKADQKQKKGHEREEKNIMQDAVSYTTRSRSSKGRGGEVGREGGGTKIQATEERPDIPILGPEDKKQSAGTCHKGEE